MNKSNPEKFQVVGYPEKTQQFGGGLYSINALNQSISESEYGNINYFCYRANGMSG